MPLHHRAPGPPRSHSSPLRHGPPRAPPAPCPARRVLRRAGRPDPRRPPQPRCRAPGVTGSARGRRARRLRRRLRGPDLRLIVHPSLAGRRVRARLSNRFGDEPVTFGAASIARRLGSGARAGHVAAAAPAGRTGISVAPDHGPPVGTDRLFAPRLRRLGRQDLAPARSCRGTPTRRASPKAPPRSAGPPMRRAAGIGDLVTQPRRRLRDRRAPHVAVRDAVNR